MAIEKEVVNDGIDLNCLNIPYMENILNKKHKSVKVTSMKVVPALGKGENFGGIISRVHLEYETILDSVSHKTVFIVKTSFEGDEFAAEKMKEYDVFTKEMNIYETVLPRLTDLMNEINDEDILFPGTEFIDYENSSIVFEDLNMKSFVMADRTEGLDLNHVRLALQKLAKMHATSAVFNKRTNGSLEKFDRGMFNRHTSSYSPLFENNLTACSDMIEEFGGPFIEYSEKLKKLRPHLMEYGKQVFDFERNFFNVLVHGDFWTNNVMYKYNENNEPEDAVLIDFQYACWGSPAIDLLYFLNTSIKEEFRLSHHEELVQYYYYILLDTLKALNFTGNIPSLHEFWIQLMAKGFYGFTSTCLIQPIMLCENNDDADFHALMDVDERAMNFKKSLYENKKVQNILKKMLPIFDRKGLIDVKNQIGK